MENAIMNMVCKFYVNMFSLLLIILFLEVEFLFFFNFNLFLNFT